MVSSMSAAAVDVSSSAGFMSVHCSVKFKAAGEWLGIDELVGVLVSYLLGYRVWSNFS